MRRHLPETPGPVSYTHLLDGLKDMAQLMKNLRENPPAEISGVKVVTRKDYTDGSVVDCATGAKSAMELSGSNVLRFELADGTTILVRPSGTEPKIKRCV